MLGGTSAYFELQVSARAFPCSLLAVMRRRWPTDYLRMCRYAANILVYPYGDWYVSALHVLSPTILNVQH